MAAARPHAASARHAQRGGSSGHQSKFATDLQRHLSFSKLDHPSTRHGRSSAASLRSIASDSTGMAAGHGRQRPASAATQRTSKSAGQLGSGGHAAGSTWGSKSQKAWVSKAGRDRGFTNNPAASLTARTIKEKGLAAAATPAKPSFATPAAGGHGAPTRARDREALPGGAAATAPRATGHARAGANAPPARGSKSASRWQGLSVSTVAPRAGAATGGAGAGAKTPVSGASHRMSGPRTLREQLMSCMVTLQTAREAAGAANLEDDDGSGSDTGSDSGEAPEDGAGVPHLSLILRVLRRSSKTAQLYLARAAVSASQAKELEACRKRLKTVEEELDSARRTAARRARDRRRVVVLDSLAAGAQPQVEGAVVAELQQTLRRVRADGQVIIDAKDREIAKLREAVESVANLKRLDTELERLRNALGQRQQDIEQTKARQAHASQLCAEVLAKTAQREHELETARARAASVNTELDAVRRKLSRQEDKLSASLARAKAVSAAGKGESGSEPPAKGGKAAKGRLEALETQNRALVKDNAGMLAELTALREQVERLNKTNHTLAAKLGSESDANKAEDDTTSMELESLRARLKEAEAQVKSRVQEALNEAKAEWESTHSDMAQQSMMLAVESARVKRELEDAKSRVRQLEGVSSRLRSDLQRASAGMNDAQQTCSELRRKVASLEDRLAEATTRVRIKERQEGESDAQINRLEKTNMDMEAQMTSMSRELSEAREAQVGRAEDLAGRLAAAADRTTAALREVREHRAAAEAAQASYAKQMAANKELTEQLTAALEARDEALQQLAAAQVEVAERQEHEEGLERSGQAAAEQVIATQQQAVALNKELGKERNAKRDLQKQLEAAKAEIETNRSFVDSTAASLAALRRKLAERDAEIEALRAAAAASAAASPGGRSDMNWARKEGVKQGRNRGAQQIKRLAAQLAELKAAYKLSTGGGVSSPASVTLGSVLSPAVGFTDGSPSRRSSLRGPMASPGLSALGASSKRAAEDAKLAEQAEQQAKQKEFLDSWAAELAERDRDLSQRMRETQETLLRLQKQQAAAMYGNAPATGASGSDARATAKERDELAKARAEVDAQKQLLKTASSVMKQRLTLQLELLRITPLLTGHTRGVPKAKVAEARRKATQVQGKLEATHKRLEEIQGRLAAVSKGEALLDLADSKAEPSRSNGRPHSSDGRRSR